MKLLRMQEAKFEETTHHWKRLKIPTLTQNPSYTLQKAEQQSQNLENEI